MNVPYIQQKDPNSCGVAALEMLYRFYGVDTLDQLEVYERIKTPAPHGNDNFYVLASSLKAEAEAGGFKVELVYPNDLQKSFEILEQSVRENVPVIVIQRFTEELPEVGHFRVVTNINKKYVRFHDPSSLKNVGGKDKRWSREKFSRFWQANANRVVPEGGYLILRKVTSD
ncbi:MAG: C39 family peptidase [Candidatus Pacebacteria bacterium]|nr:C39 family peptidase [Candidatus Paceibacterota bacterium]